MTTEKKSDARQYLEKLRGRPLTFGKMLRSLRLSDEISQVDLAEKMHVSRAYICDVENGRRNVSIEKAAQFAKVMKYPVSQFIATAIEDQLKYARLKFRVSLKKYA